MVVAFCPVWRQIIAPLRPTLAANLVDGHRPRLSHARLSAFVSVRLAARELHRFRDVAGGLPFASLNTPPPCEAFVVLMRTLLEQGLFRRSS
jgi:hypothetical protein